MRALDAALRWAGIAAILLGGWVLLARDIAPQVRHLSLGSLDRSRFDELAAMPAQGQGDTLAQLEVIREIRARTPADALFLVFTQNAFAFYAERRFIRDIDPRLTSFYRAKDKMSAYGILKQAGIDYVFLPSWTWPTIQNSWIDAIVRDPSLASLVVDRFGYRVYRLDAYNTGA
jgi:hypothetical protein